jgi:uncharacterized protein (DUF427 family)
VRVEFNRETIVDTKRAWRLLETSHPPTYYIPREDVQCEFLQASSRRTFCEFKGDACFVDDEHVQPQTGDFYGGWITSNIAGPFKSGTGTSHW